MSEQPPQPVGPETPPEGTDVDRIARLRARATQPAPDAPTVETPAAETPAAETSAAEAPAAPSPAAPSPAGPVTEPADPAPATPAAAPPTPAPGPAPAAVVPPTAAAGEYAAPPAPRARRTGRTGSGGIAAVAVLAVLAVVTVALAGLVGARLSSANAVDSTRGDVVGAATSGVATVLSYDYRHLDTDFARAQGLLTPKFRKQYDDTTAKGVRPLATKYKAISSADVSAAGVVEAARDRAVVLVFVNQTVTNSQLSAPRLDRSRIKVSLVRSNGRWLIDKLTTL